MLILGVDENSLRTKELIVGEGKKADKGSAEGPKEGSNISDLCCVEALEWIGNWR